MFESLRGPILGCFGVQKRCQQRPWRMQKNDTPHTLSGPRPPPGAPKKKIWGARSRLQLQKKNCRKNGLKMNSSTRRKWRQWRNRWKIDEKLRCKKSMFFDSYKTGLKCVRGLKILLFRPHKIIDFWSIFDRFWTHLGALLGRLGSHVAPKWPTQTFKQCHFRVFDPSEILSNFNEILTSLGNGPKSKKRLKCDRGARFWPPWNGKMAPRGPPLDFEGARKNGQKSTST